MTTCQATYQFLQQLRGRAVTTPPADADAAQLAQLGLVSFVTADQYRQMQADVSALGARQNDLAQEAQRTAQLAAEDQREEQRTHSILFHFESQEHRAADVRTEAATRQQLDAANADLARRRQEFNDLLQRRSLFDGLTACGDRYAALTGTGQVATRDLAVRLYRVADSDFAAYWADQQKVAGAFDALAAGAASYAQGLGTALPQLDRSYLWAASLDLTHRQPDASTGGPKFLNTYRAVANLTSNDENRLLAAEVLFAIDAPIEGQLPALKEVVQQVRKLGVPSESALGVASVLLLGRRADGSIAYDPLRQFLTATRSYEAAALLAVDNVPIDGLSAKLLGARSLFASWGYQASEDVELASAFLATSDLPIDGVQTKLAIVARGLNTYLEYPLVAAAILASVASLEANETLNLLEQAYQVIGRRAMPMTQSELICLGVRMVYGIRDELLRQLDTTARMVPTAPAGGPRFYPRVVFVPVFVHAAYYSTFSGVGGAHPAHAHGMAGGGFGG